MRKRIFSVADLPGWMVTGSTGRTVTPGPPPELCACPAMEAKSAVSKTTQSSVRVLIALLLPQAAGLRSGRLLTNLQAPFLPFLLFPCGLLGPAHAKRSSRRG